VVKFDDVFGCLDTSPECDRQTDGQIERIAKPSSSA